MGSITHPHLTCLFLHPTSIRSISTSLKQPNLHPFCLLPRSIMSLFVFHIHLVHVNSGASNHLSGNKDLFSSLTITSPLPMITLANGSQTLAKGIGSACSLPYVPLTSIIYVPDCPFNMIFISKLTHDLNCLITFSDNSVTLQDRSMGRTIGIGCEFQGLFHLSFPFSSTACTSMNTPLLIHSRLGHPNISKFRIMVPCFSSLLFFFLYIKKEIY